MGEVKKAISHHIFVFPFKWDYFKNSKSFNKGIDKRVNLDEFEKLLYDNYWEEEKLDIKDELEYNQYVYFYSNVRKAIYGEENCKNKIKQQKSKVTRCFKYSLVNENSKYIITKIDKEKDEFENEKSILKEFSLKLTDIKLKIYETGVANLIFFVENYKYKTDKDILVINDYGRRVYPQFLPLSNCKEKFLASKLSLEFCTGKRIDDNFDYNHFNSPMKISDIILKLLGDSFKFNECDIKENNVFLTPILDDRMFVMSLYRNDLKSNLISNGTKFIKEFLYKYTFIDNDDCTCQNNEMLSELLNQSSYLRWQKYGTFYGISRYSFTVIIDETDNSDFLVNHFKTIYYEMMLLVLTDRASVLRFKDEASKIALLSEDTALKQVVELQKLYVNFSNNIYFQEVTAQEQGIEMYDMIMDKMRIKQDIESLKNDISSIYNYSNQIISTKVNRLLRLISVIGLIISLWNATVKFLESKYVEVVSITLYYVALISFFTLLYLVGKWIKGR